MSTGPSIASTLKTFMITDDKGNVIESIHAFARRLNNFPYTTLQCILTGRTQHPDERTVMQLADALGTTPEYLRYGHGPRHVDASERQEAC